MSYRSSIRLVVEFNRLQLAQKLTRQQPKLRGDGRVLQQPLKSNCWGAVRSREGCRKTQKKTTHTKRRRRRRNKKIYKKAWNGRRVMLVPSSSSCGLSVFYFILYTIFVWFPSLCCFFFAKAPTILSTLTFGGDPRNSPADRRIKKTPEKKIKATSLKKKKKKKDKGDRSTSFTKRKRKKNLPTFQFPSSPLVFCLEYIRLSSSSSSFWLLRTRADEQSVLFHYR